ncbi:hypothetical protein [Rhizobium glycinendophyticum]|uniref:Uncharacterized protein n=1 Tax=Rhizobium glycinendophyticum TaxID=2589807 RepID=A0A504UJB6_9HYPH|nr:hypothetical protein [Rhizobium glycinendophyticum]TPP06961.1 hypothetical protein FJQ55_14930 [Rhizobium glycinendophyticum]
MSPSDKADTRTELADLANKLRDLAFALDELSSVGPEGIEASVSISEWTFANRIVPILVGKMMGHPSIKNGNIGATTEIFYIDTTAGLARSFNRWYRLGPGIHDHLVM